MSNILTCLHIHSSRVDDVLKLKSSDKFQALSLNSRRSDEPLQVCSSRSDERLIVETHRTDEALVIRSSQVCVIGVRSYLRVEPRVIWLLPENDFRMAVTVESNTNWTIE